MLCHMSEFESLIVEYAIPYLNTQNQILIFLSFPNDESWRLAPSINEKRDGYLTKMIERIERMYKENDNLPILLICHSMGAKMGHYFLNFAKHHKGQSWLDKCKIDFRTRLSGIYLLHILCLTMYRFFETVPV